MVHFFNIGYWMMGLEKESKFMFLQSEPLPNTHLIPPLLIFSKAHVMPRSHTKHFRANT